jgi:phage-related protein
MTWRKETLLTDHKKVILSMPDPTLWTFMSYVADNDRDVATEWDAPQSFEAEQALHNLMKNHRKTKSHLEWTSFRHKMKGDAGKHGVVELKADKRAYRILCMFNGPMCIVVLCICFHKSSVWTPKDAVKMATERAKAITAKKAKLNVIPIEDNL